MAELNQYFIITFLLPQTPEFKRLFWMKKNFAAGQYVVAFQLFRYENTQGMPPYCSLYSYISSSGRDCLKLQYIPFASYYLYII